MSNKSSESTHLKGVTFEIHYPLSPFYPRAPVFAQFSGVLNPDSRFFARLDSGSIPDSPNSAGIAIRGSFTLDPDKTPWRFSGFLSDNRIEGRAEARRP
jgi:hypothetical protein